MSQSSKFKEFVEELPTPTEIWEQAVEKYVNDGMGMPAEITTLQDGREVIFWEDGAGNEAHFLRPALPGGDEDSIAVRIFDHESEFNLYGQGDLPQPPLVGIPDEFQTTLDDQNLFWFQWDEEAKQAYATAFLWNTDGVWEYTDAFAEALQEAEDDGGVSYILKSLTE